jgi:hypothetical protein
MVWVVNITSRLYPRERAAVSFVVETGGEGAKKKGKYLVPAEVLSPDLPDLSKSL